MYSQALFVLSSVSSALGRSVLRRWGGHGADCRPKRSKRSHHITWWFQRTERPSWKVSGKLKHIRHCLLESFLCVLLWYGAGLIITGDDMTRGAKRKQLHLKTSLIYQPEPRLFFSDLFTFRQQGETTCWGWERRQVCVHGCSLIQSALC